MLVIFESTLQSREDTSYRTSFVPASFLVFEADSFDLFNVTSLSKSQESCFSLLLSPFNGIPFIFHSEEQVVVPGSRDGVS